MEESKLKNMVVLKNLPSNLVEEAIIVLKSNKKDNTLFHRPSRRKIRMDSYRRRDGAQQASHRKISVDSRIHESRMQHHRD